MTRKKAVKAVWDRKGYAAKMGYGYMEIFIYLGVGQRKYLYPTQYDVGVDFNDFTPVSYEQVRTKIINQMEQR